MVCSSTFILIYLTLEISSKTKILFKASLTGHQIDNVNTITMKDTSCIISYTGDTACKIIET